MRPFSTFVLVCALILTLGACAWGDQDGLGDDGDAPTPLPMPVCGDGLCAGPEVGACVADCGNPSSGPKCGNSRCEAGESNANCASDCPAQSQCGNNVCDTGETTANCPNDCPAQGNCPADPLECFACATFGFPCPSGHDQNTCTACILGGGGAGCAGGFPNGTCDAGENMTNCPFDCP
jgi:hypothetical protein